MNLRPRQKQPFAGFTKAEKNLDSYMETYVMPSMEQVQKMEQLLKDTKEQSRDVAFFKDLAKVFNRSSNRAGKPILKWAQIQSWFKTRQESHISVETSSNEDKAISEETSSDGAKESLVPYSLNQSKASGNPKILEGLKSKDPPTMEFEAKSSTDGAWYDVEKFLSLRCLSSGDIESYVRFIGFGPEEDEWVNVKNDIRERSVALEHSECHKLKAGDPVVCFQERQDQAKYYDARLIDIQRRLHDVRGCRCLFLIKYDHDSSQEKVQLRRLCSRPNLLTRRGNR